MTTIFDVTPEELERSAREIEADVVIFRKAYDDIYAAVGELKVEYKGEASDTFNRRIEERRKDFEAATTALKKYVDTVREYAKNQRTNEAALKNQASVLS